MKCTLEEFKIISELEEAVVTVGNLTKILTEYMGDKEVLIDILLEKYQVMEENLIILYLV